MAGAGAAGHTLSTSTLSALAHADLLFRTFREAASRARFGHTTVDYTSLPATGLYRSSSCSGHLCETCREVEHQTRARKQRQGGRKVDDVTIP